jgi:hypothetical protein
VGDGGGGVAWCVYREGMIADIWSASRLWGLGGCTVSERECVRERVCVSECVCESSSVRVIV